MCLIAIALIAFPALNGFIQAPFWLLSQNFLLSVCVRLDARNSAAISL